MANEKYPTFTANEWVMLRVLVTNKLKELSSTTPPGEKQDQLLAHWQDLEDRIDEAASATFANGR